jgi:hypothetical protein
MKLLAAAAAGIAVFGAAGGLARAAQPSFATTTDCPHHQAFVAGDEAAVAARLPRRYTPVRDPSSGNPLLFVRAVSCRDLTVGERSGPVVLASVGVVIESPDGWGCASGAPVLGPAYGEALPACNWYALSWLASDRRVIDWLRAGTPDFPGTYVPGLEFELGAFDPALGGAPFRFRAPAPAPSPFTIDAVGRERPDRFVVRGGYWADTDEGTVKLAFSTEDLSSGDANGVVTAAPGSELATLFGAEQRSYAAGYSSIAAERWEHAVYRKQLLGPARRGEELHSFAGSCSLEGTNTFTPPATNTKQPLTVRYDASGTCTGTLDGREVTDAPVTLRSLARSNPGSCPEARTTTPGQGAITFRDGTTIRNTFDFTSRLTEVDLTMYGERSGSARAPATFRTQRRDPDVAMKCAGEGAETVPMDMTIRTVSPLVSSDRSRGRGARGRRLRLSVRPRSVRAGRETTLAFRVVTAQRRRRVVGALVRFGGRRVRTGRRGRARIVVTLHRPGQRSARASKRGFRPARATIRVRTART